MSDDESDPEAQGIDALRLLKHGNHSIGGAPKLAGGVEVSAPISVPLVSLLPSQKRSRSLSQDLTDQARPTTSQKFDPRREAGILRQPPLNPAQGSRERDIRQHKSAPEQCLNLAKELRSCRSAPDLTIPALAAIRGLQDGTLQVDKYTRFKIAAAAKRVLEARELKRRTSQDQERESQSQHPYPPVDPVSPLATKGQPMWDRPSQSLPAVCEPLAQAPSLEAKDSGRRPESGVQQTDLPESLSTAAAIARGQSPQTGKGNFHRPALGTVSQNGALLSSSHHPFTVTTGLPRFAQVDGPAASEQLKVPSTPWKNAAAQGSAVQRLDSKVLTISDLQAAGVDRK